MSTNSKATVDLAELERSCPGLRYTDISQEDAAKVTKAEEDLLELEGRVCSHGDTVHYAERPTFFETCEGSFLYDGKQQPYLDLQMWYSAVNLGYANKRVNQALKDQIDKLPQLACQYLHKEKVQLADRLVKSVKRTLGEDGRVHFNVGGAQAVEDALKLVRKHTGKSRMLAFEGGYHGRTLAASSITSSYRYRENYGEFGDRAEFVPFPYCFRCPFGKKVESCGMYCLDQIERKFEHEYTSWWNPKSKKSEFGAFFIEVVQGTGGYIIPPKGYFARLAKILREHGILIVDDEIQMGFFRTGKLWAMEHTNTAADILVFGKALTNGLNPLSAIWAKEELISPDKFGPGSTHSTFSSNSLGTATALEVMKIFDEGDYEKTVTEKGAYFLNILKDLQSKHPEIGDVDGLGLALRMEMCEKDSYTPSRRLADTMFQRGLEGNLSYGGKKTGLILDIGGYYKNVVTLAPSLEITHKEMDMAHDLLDQLITSCKKEL
ncbi:MAG: aminotransferase class III-fold pyridoxal phosphate-dependent enzyme [Candidatus Obscuribacterales bacterium]|nr:aminotransferase class III-fold pyridoxal phosphate-dependent enzyme [Candidatus Obscuribacterales bacterium]